MNPTKDKAPQSAKVRPWTRADLPALVDCHHRVYRGCPPEELYDQRLFAMKLEAFPEGQLLVELAGRVVGYATSLIVQLDDHVYTYGELTGSGTFSTHDPSGDTLYGSDIGILPEHRGQGLAQLLYKHRRRLMRRYNLRRMVAYGRIPGFKDHEGRMTAQEYVEAVRAGRLRDPALNAHLRAGYEVRRVLLNFTQDQDSLHYMTWLEMPNPDHRPGRRRIASASLSRPNRRVRVCAAQYRMRELSGWQDFVDAVEFFVDTADTDDCHALVFPELFTANLFSTFPRDLSSQEATERLAGLTDQFVAMMQEKARAHRIHIIGGSHPTLREGKLYNVAYLFTPAGNVYTQDKLHITPGERHVFGIQPGERLRVFDTALGKIAIQVCYDVEFPEATRLLAMHGAEIIFVPFSTAEKKGYNRVRYTAQARAVENYVYMVLAGCVGNLPKVKAYLLNYGRSCVLTPSDFAFPTGAVEGEADPNVDTVVIAELDLTTLHTQREQGTVRPLYERRPDLYSLTAKVPVEVIRTE